MFILLFIKWHRHRHDHLECVPSAPKHKCAQIASLYLYLQPEPRAKTPTSPLFSSPLSHCLCLTYTHTNTQRTLEKIWNICLVAEHSFRGVANEHAGLWQGLESVLLPCLTYYSPPFHLLFLFNPPEHDPYPVGGVFLERLCHTWQLSMAQTRWDLTGHGCWGFAFLHQTRWKSFMY